MKTFKKLASLTLVTCSLCFALTGCGNSDNGSTSGNNDNNVVGDTAGNVGNAAGDLVEGAGDAAVDIADGVGNAVDDLVGTNGFDNYDDARKYFIETMSNYHPEAKFEVRDEERDLEDYQEGSKGYHFKLYDTSKNQTGELFGEFYVDANTGVIYRDLDDDQVSEYRGTMDDNNNAAGTSRTGENAGTTGGGNDNGSTTGNGSDAGTDANGGNGTAGNTNGGTAGAAQ